MQNRQTPPIDYLVIGHITQDLVEGGVMLGGTASYSTLTAFSLGMNTALLTACPRWLELPELANIIIQRKASQYATTFENIETETGRHQIVHQCAAMISEEDVPEAWQNARIVHLGPIAAEINPNIINAFPNAFLGLTPQGWMRIWGADGRVHFQPWQNSGDLLERADAVVFSVEDLQGNEELISEYAQATRVLAVTEGFNGARVYWNGDVRHITAPMVKVANQTGAGDIFAAVFFTRLYQTKNPWEAGKQAVQLASQSVTRIGLAGIPSLEEIRRSLVDVVTGS